MKTVEEISKSVTIGGAGGETVDVVIAANGNIIRGVIHSIYSDKHKTVTRELMSNAFDAHIAAGISTTPIEVLLPTSSDPVFVVRDFGVGMDHDFVMKHYSSLGFSTKGDANDQTGMFGVGSKSPLSISDTFSIRCFDKAERRVRMYTVFFASDGRPQLQHTFTTESSPEDRVSLGGTEVRVPVSFADREKLVQGIGAQQAAWFDKPVAFVGHVTDLLELKYEDFNSFTPGVFLAKRRTRVSSSYRSYADLMYIRQGSAIYPVSDSHLSAWWGVERDIIHSLAGDSYDVIFDAPVGTFDVTMARESIQYNASSVANITALLKARGDACRAVLEDAIKDSYTVPDATKELFENVYGRTLQPRAFSDIALATSLLKGVISKVVKNWTAAVNAGVDTDAPKPAMTLDVYGKHLNDEGAFFQRVHVRSNANLSNSVAFDAPCASLTLSNPVVFYVIPAHMRAWRERVEKHIVETYPDGVEAKQANFYVVKVPKNKVAESKKSLDAFFMLKEVFVPSDLPEIEKATSGTRVNYSRTSAYTFGHAAWESTKVEPDYGEPALYFVRSGLSTFVEGVKGDPAARTTIAETEIRALVTTYRALNPLLDPSIPIYRVSPSQAENVVDKELWIDVVAACKKHLKNIIADPISDIHTTDLAVASQRYDSKNRSNYLNVTVNVRNLNDAHLRLFWRLCEHDSDFITVAALADSILPYKQRLKPEYAFGPFVEEQDNLRYLRSTLYNNVSTGRSALHKLLDETFGYLLGKYSGVESISRLDSDEDMLYVLDQLVTRVTARTKGTNVLQEAEPLLKDFVEIFKLKYAPTPPVSQVNDDPVSQIKDAA